jgi:uncharacterized Zn-binding protein involved in type VI secretion
MPGVVRVGKDFHVGHASPSPNPFHQTAYATGSPNVYTNDAKTVRIGDTTACTDVAVGSSPNVYANNILVHRLNDATGGHASWVPNSATTSSINVYANGDGGTAGSVDPDASSGPVIPSAGGPQLPSSLPSTPDPTQTTGAGSPSASSDYDWNEHINED